ncbi:hypothetical protein [Nucisporomicrobium flavum]|uniref:hypothetical protein n=1 Tax=Nucisporomicrobium flavum TaxID=2785915 RepID=UPI0018F2FF70|nr:hypothetical protein [Nucisporomicrobium flavum]
MSLVLWHKIRIAPAEGGGGLLGAVASFAGIGLPLTVTNDVYAGGLALDAEVSISMGEGAAADTFSITLTDLPASQIAQLRAGYPSGGLTATISLGYFDEPITRFGAGPVMTGRVIAVTTGIGGGGVSRTVIEGQEEAGYKLLKKAARLDRPKNLPRLTLVRDLVQAAEVTLARQSTIPGSVGDISVCTATTLTALRELADAADVPLVVGDGEVRLGAAVGATPAPVRVDPDLNLVSRVDAQKEDVTPGVKRGAGAGPPVRTGLEVTVLGHPGLRPGQTVTVSGLDDVPPGPLRISRVTHVYGAANGYTCTLVLTAVAAGVRVRAPGGVQGVVDRWQDVITRNREDHPAVDVGVVTAYRPGKDGRHLADLHYGQNPPAGEVAPSVTSEVSSDVELHNKPVASPFAFHKVGLVTPVYPKMRALLAHNRGLVNDAVATGWIWSEKPRLEPPPNEPGDYWLALPTGLDGDGLPTGKGVNDLTDAGGHRAIQARALHITVGQKSLPDVGTRPTPPADDTVVIEHHSGTRITINADGEVTIATDQKSLTLTNGQVSMKLDGAKVAIS